MATETDYHGWLLPDEGADWADAYYEFADSLDAGVIRAGPVAERPTSAPHNALWYATDEDRVYRFDRQIAFDWQPRLRSWGEYELVWDDDEPLTDKYIRLETV